MRAAGAQARLVAPGGAVRCATSPAAPTSRAAHRGLPRALRTAASARALAPRASRALHRGSPRVRRVSASAAAGDPEEDETDDSAPPAQRGDLSHETDVVIIGAGVSGLCCAAVLASAGVSVTVCEAHTVAGGAAHHFSRSGHTFDAGPSFYFGLQDQKGTSLNALKQVLDLLGEAVPCASYDRWTVHTGPASDSQRFQCTTSASEYGATIARLGGPQAAQQWAALQARIAPLSAMAAQLPFAALRGDAAAPLALARFAPGLASGAAALAAAPGGVPASIAALQGSFGDVLRSAGVTDPWLRSLLDLETFVISGCLADATPAPEMAFVMSERFRAGATLDHPIGGGRAWIDALLRGIKRRGGRVQLRCPVEQVVVEGGRAAGVRLAGGRGTVRARRAVVSSASVWDTAARLLPAGALPAGDTKRAAATPECGSFLHLHLGFDATGLDLAATGIHHLVVDDFRSERLEDARNVVNISIPTALDASLAPAGRAVAHVYGAANEPYDDWAGLTRGSAAYSQLKEERSEALWAALERVIPDVRQRAGLQLIGTPLTHERYLRRNRGSYGPAPAVDAWPGPRTALPGLLACGDSTFPGIGVPAAAASGVIAANTLLPIWEHFKVLDGILARE